jgi:hypothetical protein
MSNSTPEQRVPVKVSVVTGVLVSSVRFGRDRLGLRRRGGAHPRAVGSDIQLM